MGRIVIPGFRKIETSGGGEGGTTNYNDLTNKPSINNVPLVGNLKTLDLKLTDATLTEEGVPAEAKTVGTKLEEQSTSLTAVKEGLTKKANISDIPTKVSELQNDSNYQTDTDVTTALTTYATKTYVGEQISSADHLKREIVTEIPSPETADKNTIYMLKIESAMGEDKYKEYLLIDGTVQCIGDTSVDLTDYAKKTEIPTELPANGGNSATVNGHTVKSDVPENAVFTDTVYDDTEVKEEIANINSNLTSEISRAKETEEVLKSRIDTITSLPEGSTTGDAELQDIRVKADGTTATTAGNAVREQVSELKSDLEELSTNTENLYEHLNYSQETSVDFNGQSSHYGNFYLSDYLPVEKYKYVSFKLLYFTTLIAPVVFYDANKNVTSVVQKNECYDMTKYSGGIDLMYGFVAIPGDAKYVRFNKFTGEDKYNKNLFIKLYKEKPSIITVSKKCDGDVFTINGAKSLYSVGDNINIFLKNGIYNEVVSFKGDYNSVILTGEDINNTIIRMVTGKYIDSPLVVWGKFLIENISIEMMIGGAGDWYPTYSDSDVVNTYPGYALHIDGASRNVGETAKGLVRNCYIYSEAFPAVGMGLSKNQYITFDNCEIIRNCTNDVYKKDNWRGAFLCHNSTGAEHVENQNLILKNCTFKSNYGYSCHLRLNLAILNSSKNFNLTAINNSFYSDDLGQDSCYYEKGDSILNPISNGNSDEDLNIMGNSKQSYQYNNLFDLPLDFKVGSLQGNIISPSDGWNVTPYIIPKLGSDIVYNASSVDGAVNVIMFYDRNYTPIPEYTVNNDKGTYTVPNDSNIKYMRCCLPNKTQLPNGYIGGEFYLK